MRCHICGGNVVVVCVYDIRIVRCSKCGYVYKEEIKGGEENDRHIHSEPGTEGAQ